MDYADFGRQGTPSVRVIPIPPAKPPPPFVPSDHMQTPGHYPFVPPVQLSPVPFLPPVQLSPFIPPTCLPLVYSTAANPQPLPSTPWVRPHEMPYTIPPLPTSPGTLPIWPVDAAIMPNPNSLIFPPNSPVLLEPGTFPAEPWGTPVPIRIHPHLLYNPYNPLAPILQWDIIHRAEQARALTGRDVYVPVKLSDQATLPASPKIWISSDHPYLAAWMEEWGPIVVEMEKITVRDILDAIWEYFQQPLAEDEYDRIKATPNGLTNLTYAARQRAKDSYDLRSVTRRNGFKRADVLGGHRRFQGLRPVAYADMTWKAFLGLLPGPVPRFT